MKRLFSKSFCKYTLIAHEAEPSESDERSVWLRNDGGPTQTRTIFEISIIEGAPCKNIQLFIGKYSLCIFKTKITTHK